MAAEEDERRQSPASSGSWSGPSSGGRSIQTFNSEAASDPMWREPVERLRRWKHRVAHDMSLLRQQGQEGMDVIKSQELRARGRYTDLLMSDGSQLPDNLSFWKSRHDYFAQAWRQIQAKKSDGHSTVVETVNPSLDWIRDWISDTRAAEEVDRSGASRDTMCERQSCERPAATVRQSKATEKRCRDADNGAGKGGTLPRKRSKRDPSDLARTTSEAAPSKRIPKQNPKKVLPPVAVPPNRRRGGVAARDKAGVGNSPPRRSPCLAAFYASKAVHDEAGPVGRPVAAKVAAAAAIKS